MRLDGCAEKGAPCGMDDLQPAFGLLVRQRRQSLGLATKELAGRMHCTRQYVERIERGKASVGLKALRTFAGALEMLPSLLLSDALGEEWTGWWGPVVDSTEDRAPFRDDPTEYDLGRAAGYSDALIDAEAALDDHVRTRVRLYREGGNHAV